MFTSGITVDQINEFGENCMVGHLGIEVIEIGKDFIKAKMPVDERTKQPLGLLHGGASVALAETLGSIACTFSIDPSKQYCVGIDINANHVRTAKSGHVIGIAKPIHMGRTTQVWEIKITNEEDKLVSISRITLGIMDIKK